MAARYERGGRAAVTGIKSWDLESNVISVHLHDIETESIKVEGLGQVLAWQLKTFPDVQKAVVDVTEDVHLPACVSAKTLKLERTDCE